MLTANGTFARFTVTSAHLTMLILLLFERDTFNSACGYPQSEQTLTDTRFIIALSFSIALLVVELVIFLLGPSLLQNKVTFTTTILHSAGAISLAFMVFTRWCSVTFWAVFAVCSGVPFFIEIFNAFSYNMKN